MKKLCILSPDAVNLPLASNCPDSIYINGILYSTKSKCCNAAATGIRAQKFAEYLSTDFDVTLLIPDLNHPGKNNIDYSKLSYSIESYNYKKCSWEYSKELKNILSKFDIVILQCTGGIGFKNIVKLRPHIRVILDGYIPLLAEFPAAVSYHTDEKLKKYQWLTLLRQYSELLKRADLILYANDRQKRYYEGQLFLLNKLNVDNYKNSPLLKIPYGITWHKPVTREHSDKLKLLWYGPFYPWYDFENLITNLYNHSSIKIDFYGIQHPRFTRFLQKSVNLDYINTSSNMKIIGEYNSLDPRKLFEKYDACICLSQHWLENRYSHRARIFEVMSYGMPVIITNNSPILEESKYLDDRLIYEIVGGDFIREELEDIKAFSNLLHIDISAEHELLYSQYNWDSILKPLKLTLLEEMK